MSQNPLAYEADDAGNAAYCAALLQDRFLYAPAYGWMIFTGTHWDRTGAQERIRPAVIERLRERNEAARPTAQQDLVRATKSNRSQINATLEILQSFLYAEISEFDRDPDELNCANGILNLCTGELTPHDASQRFTYCTGVRYDPDASAAEWLRFITEAVDDEQELVDYLQLAVGYSLTGHTREEVFFYLSGPTRSGKGTFTETIRQVLGKALSAEVGFNTFTIKRAGDNNNFDLAPLKPCRFVAAGESDRYDRLSSPDIKRFTGGDSIRCSFKYKPVFEYRPQFKIWLSSNEDVRADPDDGALWARIRIIPFPNSHAGEENKDLKAQLQQPQVLEGILSWAVEGAIKWYRLGSNGLAQPHSVRALSQEAKDANDSVGQWLDACVRVVDDPERFTCNADLYRSYENYCEDNGIQWPKQMAGLTRSLKTKGFAAGVPKKVKGRTVRGCAGLIIW